VVDEVVTVSWDVPDPPATDGGLKLHPAPLGKPVQESDTVLLNPATGVRLMVEDAESPAVTVAGDNAEAEISNPGATPDSGTFC
jgi:hypothetical protein